MYTISINIISKKKIQTNIINIYACFINIYVPHEVKNQHALATRTSQFIEHFQEH